MSEIQREAILAQQALLDEIVACLCYQPEMPLAHKQDMAKKLKEAAEKVNKLR